MPIRPKRARTVITEEKEKQIVTDLMNPDLTIADIAAKHEISGSTVSRINGEYNENGKKEKAS